MKSTFAISVIATLLILIPASGIAQTTAPPALPAPTPGVECSEYVPPEERKNPERLAVRGVACFEDGEYLLALRHYREARRLSDSNLLNAAIGRVFQELGYPFIARRYYRDYLSGRIDSGEGRQRIEQRLATVEQELADQGAEVVVESSPPEARIFVVVEDSHWEDLGRTPLTVRLTPGKHHFVLQKEGYLTQTRQVSVSRGEEREAVEVAFIATDAAWGIPGRTLRRAGVVSMAASVPLLVTGVSLYAVGSMKKSDAELLVGDERSEMISSGSSFQQWGAVGMVLGVAALTTGTVLWVVGRPKSLQTTPDETITSAEDGPSARIIPLIGPSFLGARLEF